MTPETIPTIAKIVLVTTVGFGVDTLSGCVNHASVPITTCNSKQLQIYEVAVDTPGMSKTLSIYGIINIAKTPCKLPDTTPIVWKATKDNHKLLVAIPSEISSTRNTSSNNELIVEPSYKQDHIPKEKLVWFSIHGAAACSPDNKEYVSEFVKNKIIAIKLPGLINDKGFFVSYNGYAECGLDDITRLQKDISHWEVISNDRCSPYLVKKNRKLKTDEIFFKKLMYCG